VDSRNTYILNERRNRSLYRLRPNDNIPKYFEGKSAVPQRLRQVKFDLFREVKSIIKHLLVADVCKRLGMLKGGADDVKQHRLFAKIDWKALLSKKILMNYRPQIKSPGDTTNFQSYPESDNITQSMKPADDPFTDW
jgi:hypothetical protein